MTTDQYWECMKLELLKQIADNLARIADILEGKEAGNEVDHRQRLTTQEEVDDGK